MTREEQNAFVRSSECSIAFSKRTESLQAGAVREFGSIDRSALPDNYRYSKQRHRMPSCVALSAKLPLLIKHRPLQAGAAREFGSVGRSALPADLQEGRTEYLTWSWIGFDCGQDGSMALESLFRLHVH